MVLHVQYMYMHTYSCTSDGMIAGDIPHIHVCTTTEKYTKRKALYHCPNSSYTLRYHLGWYHLGWYHLGWYHLGWNAFCWVLVHVTCVIFSSLHCRRSLLPTWSVPACCNPYHSIVLQMHAYTTSMVTGFAPPTRPAVGHHGIGAWCTS